LSFVQLHIAGLGLGRGAGRRVPGVSELLGRTRRAQEALGGIQAAEDEQTLVMRRIEVRPGGARGQGPRRLPRGRGQGQRQERGRSRGWARTAVPGGALRGRGRGGGGGQGRGLGGVKF